MTIPYMDMDKTEFGAQPFVKTHHNGTLSREMLSAITEALTAAFMTFFVQEGVNMTIEFSIYMDVSQK